MLLKKKNAAFYGTLADRKMLFQNFNMNSKIPYPFGRVMILAKLYVCELLIFHTDDHDPRYLNSKIPKHNNSCGKN